MAPAARSRSRSPRRLEGIEPENAAFRRLLRREEWEEFWGLWNSLRAVDRHVDRLLYDPLSSPSVWFQRHTDLGYEADSEPE